MQSEGDGKPSLSGRQPQEETWPASPFVLWTICGQTAEPALQDRRYEKGRKSHLLLGPLGLRPLVVRVSVQGLVPLCHGPISGFLALFWGTPGSLFPSPLLFSRLRLSPGSVGAPRDSGVALSPVASGGSEDEAKYCLGLCEPRGAPGSPALRVCPPPNAPHPARSLSAGPAARRPLFNLTGFMPTRHSLPPRGPRGRLTLVTAKLASPAPGFPVPGATPV